MKPAVQVLSSELKKQIGDAMVEFVTKKFPFDANSTCEV
jgi:type VI protein secretion system component VasK